MEKKSQTYKFVKIAGGVVFIPFILFAGPVSGYFAGVFLADRLQIKFFLPEILAAVGFIASLFETARIIRIVSRMEQRSQ